MSKFKPFVSSDLRMSDRNFKWVTVLASQACLRQKSLRLVGNISDFSESSEASHLF